MYRICMLIICLLLIIHLALSWIENKLMHSVKSKLCMGYIMLGIIAIILAFAVMTIFVGESIGLKLGGILECFIAFMLAKTDISRIRYIIKLAKLKEKI